MTAEIAPFTSVYLERITQLIDKTNQFNLTTRRLASPEVDAIAGDSGCITLYGRLADRFGDNGLVSVMIGKIRGDTVEVELWLMSCRVFNREMASRCLMHSWRRLKPATFVGLSAYAAARRRTDSWPRPPELARNS